MCVLGFKEVHRLRKGVSTMRTLFTFPFVCLLIILTANSLHAQWVQTNGLASDTILSLAAIRTAIFAGTDSGFFRLGDRNGIWSKDTELTSSSTNPVLSILPVDSGIFVGTQGDGIIHFSRSSGWSAIASTAGYTARSLKLVTIPEKGIMDIDFSGASGGNFFGLFQLPILLGAFRACSALNRYVFVCSCLERTPTILVGTDNGVWHSTDDGDTWTGDTLGMESKSVISLANIDSLIYAGATGGGVYRTTDLGKGWTSVSSGLTDMTINALAACDSVLYAGTNAGVFVSTDRGDNWTVAGKELMGVPVRVLAVQYDGIGGADIIAGTDGKGVWVMPVEIPQCLVLSRMFPPNWNLGTRKGTTFTGEHGIVLRNLTQRNIVPQGLPPESGKSQIYTYSGIMDLYLSTNGGAAYNYYWAETRDSIRLTSSFHSNANKSFHSSSQGETYNMEILGHDIFGGNLPGISFHLDTGFTSAGVFTLSAAKGEDVYLDGSTITCKLYAAYAEQKQLLSRSQIFDPVKYTPANFRSGSHDVVIVPDLVTPAGGTIATPLATPITTTGLPCDLSIDDASSTLFVCDSKGKQLILFNPYSVTPATANKGLLDINLDGQSYSAPFTAVFTPTDTVNHGLVHILNRQITHMEFSGGTLPPKYKLRSSPTVPSTSTSSFRPVYGGTEVTSSYDIVYELSTDAGATWWAADKPMHFELENCSITQPYQVRTDWNLVSVPVVAHDFRKDILFPASVSSAFAYRRAYVEQDTLADGTGYWLKFGTPRTDSLPGLMLLADSIAVRERWNMIGSISRPVAVSSITCSPKGMTTGSFYGYEDGYHIVDTIYPGKGYWVKVNMAGFLILDACGTAGGAKIVIRPTSEMPPPPPDDGESAQKPLPVAYALKESYPNPFNPTTTIIYQLPKQSHVTLKIFDVLGREVATLVNRVEEPGSKSVMWDARNIPSGVYFYRFQAGEFTGTRKMLLIR